MTARHSATTPSVTADQKPRGLLHYIGIAVSAAVLIIVLGLAALAIVVPAAVGGKALTVLTQSMEPDLPPGTLIIIRPTPVQDIHLGMVLTYQIKSDQPALESHRVISKSTDTHGNTTFITKGDNNDVADSPAVKPVQIKGTLWYSIPLLGYVNTFIGAGARGIIVPIIAGLLFVYAAYLVVSAIVGRRRRKVSARSPQ